MNASASTIVNGSTRRACAIFLFASLPSFVAFACSSSSGGSTSSVQDAGGFVDERQRLDAPIHPAAPCLVTIDTPPIEEAKHVAVGTPVTYDSNPPSSGAHYPYWAAFKAFPKPIDPRYWVHDLEHGAVVLLYKCSTADGCPDTVTALRGVADALADDPVCLAANQGVRVRVVMMPSVDIPTPIAAAAWGWTYTAECLDTPTLTSFALEHYAQGVENLCTNGIENF